MNIYKSIFDWIAPIFSGFSIGYACAFIPKPHVYSFLTISMLGFLSFLIKCGDKE